MNKIFVALIALFLFVGCENKTPKIDPSQRTVFMYAVANNNLKSYIKANIEVMQENFIPNIGCRLLVFYNEPVGSDRKGRCSLLEIEKLPNGDVTKAKVLKMYAGNPDPSDAATLAMAVKDMRELAPADSYSLIFSSHGTGWLPVGMHPAKVAPPADDVASYTFGGSSGFSTEMEIVDMAAALPSDIVFEMIAFDACYMASVEVAYEFRHKARYFVGSSAEILGIGFPYKNAMRSVLTSDAQGLARDYYDYYNAQTGSYRSATIAAIKCSELESVAAEVATLVGLGGDLTAKQQFGRYLGLRYNYSNLLWDLGDMVHQTWGSTPAFDAALARAVTYQGATPMMFEGDGNGQIKVNAHCGMTAYIPRLSQPLTLEIYKRDYAWARDTKLYTLAQ